MFPLTHRELGRDFRLEECLHWGSLPKIFSLADPLEKSRYLKAYAQTYLREEVQAEQLLRKLEPFRFFLEVAAQSSGKIINASNVGRDIGADVKTVQSYYRILEDTWLGFFLPAFHTSFRKSQRSKPKFYLFDLGVLRALSAGLRTELTPSTAAYGEAFEHLVILECFRLNHYFESDYKLSFFSSDRGLELDLVMSRGKELVLAEIKSSRRVDLKEVERLDRLTSDFPKDAKRFYLSQDPEPQRVGGVRCLEWRDFLAELWPQKAFATSKQ